MKRTLILLFMLTAYCISFSQIVYDNDKITTGAERTPLYVSKLKNKRVAIVANRTSVIKNTHLVDSLQRLGITISKVFGPEHGFRGNASAGTKVGDEIDEQTGLKIVSLYGSKKKPSKDDLADVDIVIFDIQDVGCRFYTIMNTMRDVMEACAENNKPVIILDRPNPNGYFVDGPILDMKHKSGIGQFPIPIVHGMTLGEFALMINGEGWTANKVRCDLDVIPVGGYKRDMMYKLPIIPSPNLNTPESILLYPSTCLFEGGSLNHGRGTYFPFMVIGGPMLKDKYSFNYIPKSIPGMAEEPLYMNQVCYGLDLRNEDMEALVKTKKINLSWLIELYNNHPQKEKFFDRSISKQIGNIDNLIGYADFKKQIAEGWTEEQIRKTWEPGLTDFMKLRAKYLIYP